MEAYKRVEAARAKGRPSGRDYVDNIIDGFLEMHGDRRFGDDGAIVAGVGWLRDMPVTVIAIDRGRDTKESCAETSAALTRKATAKPCARCTLRKSFIGRSSALWTPQVHTAASKRRSGDRHRRLRKI